MKKLYYAEFVQDRYNENYVGIATITVEQLEQLAEAYIQQDDEKIEELMVDGPKVIKGRSPYLMFEVFMDSKSPKRQLAAIRRSLDSVKGSWGKYCDEGSIAFGVTKKAAIDRINELEKVIF